MGCKRGGGEGGGAKKKRKKKEKVIDVVVVRCILCVCMCSDTGTRTLVTCDLLHHHHLLHR